MSRTFIRQSTQVAPSESFDDTLADSGAGVGLQSQLSIEGDLNALRSIVKRVSGEANWYADRSGRSLSEASADLDAAETNIGTLQTDLAQEVVDRGSADSALDGRLTTAEGEIDTLQTDLTALTGRVTTAEGDISTLQSDLAQEITDRTNADTALQSDIDTRVLKAGDTMSGMLSFSSGGFTLVPTDPAHATTKQYVDALVTGLKLKAPVAARVDVSGGVYTIDDGAMLSDGERCFVFDADDSRNSGIYIYSYAAGTASYSRAADYAEGSDASSTFFFVERGINYGDTSWVQTGTPATVGTYYLFFSQMFGAGAYLAGLGLDLTGNTFSIPTNGIETSMIQDSAITWNKINDGAVGTAALSDSAVTTAKIVDLAVTNDKIADGTIAEAKLAFAVYTESEVDSALALKLDLAGGTMSGSIAMGSNSITGLAAPSADDHAANKAYVDSQMSSVQARGTKTFVTVVSPSVAADSDVSPSNLSGSLPNMSAGSFESDYDVFVNGMLLRPGANSGTNNDYYPGTDLLMGNLRFEFALSYGDTICVVEYN